MLSSLQHRFNLNVKLMAVQRAVSLQTHSKKKKKDKEKQKKQ